MKQIKVDKIIDPMPASDGAGVKLLLTLLIILVVIAAVIGYISYSKEQDGADYESAAPVEELTEPTPSTETQTYY